MRSGQCSHYRASGRSAEPSVHAAPLLEGPKANYEANRTDETPWCQGSLAQHALGGPA